MRIVPALDRGLAILDLLSDRADPIGIAAIATELRIPRSASYELVHTLRARRYLEQDREGMISLGPQVFTLGSCYSDRLDVAKAAQEVATAVLRRCDETVQVGVLDGRDVLYIARADSTRPVRLVSAVGRRVPAHCTAIGKVLLAELAPRDLDARLQGRRLEPVTPQSIVDLDQLRAALDVVRREGIAHDNRESNPDVQCVAAPVRDITGTCIAAISIATPIARITPESQPKLLDAVRSGAAELSARLGFAPAAALTEEHA